MKTRAHAPRRVKEREKKILFSLVEYYIRTGKPVGSQSLQESEFSDISSATIRNYFAALDEAGYLHQQHASGGRIPQSKAFQEYAKYCFEKLGEEKGPHDEKPLPLVETVEATNVVTMLQHFGELLSQKSHSPIAVSSPRFDHDIVSDLHFVFIDVSRTLAVITTEFGLVHTAVITTPDFSFSHALLKKAERFARSRLFREPLEHDLFEGNELEQVRRLFQEAMASYFVSYSSVSQEDLWRAGFSRLLGCKEFSDVSSLAASLSLFENGTALRGFMRDAIRSNSVKFWVGEELVPYAVGEPNATVIAVPYHVGTRPVGAIALVTSMRQFFLPLFRLLQDSAGQLDRALTKSLMHNRISYRMPESHAVFTKEAQMLALEFEQHPRLGHAEK